MENSRLIFLIEPNCLLIYNEVGVHKFNFTQFELYNGLVHNPTKIAWMIIEYLKNQRYNRSSACVAIASALLQEQIIIIDDLTWQTSEGLQICQILNSNSYYLATLAPELWWQYYALFRQIGVYVERYTSQSIYFLNYLQKNNLALLQTIIDTKDLQKLSQITPDFHELIKS